MDPQVCCMGFSLIGSLFLTFIGTLCLRGYPYLRLECDAVRYEFVGSGPHPGWTCIYAAGIYLLIIIIILVYRSYSRKRRSLYWDTGSSSSDEDEPLVKLEKKKIR